MTPFITAGAGFLLAVLWFDLMFDVQVWQHRREEDLPAEVVDSIATYYARVTTAARPMNRLIALVMLATVGAVIAQVARWEDPRWAAWASLALVIGAVGLAATHTVPARAILRDHVACFIAISVVLIIQLT